MILCHAYREANQVANGLAKLMDFPVFSSGNCKGSLELVWLVLLS